MVNLSMSLMVRLNNAPFRASLCVFFSLDSLGSFFAGGMLGV